ncbi:MAG: DUF3800 domain-containing protein [Pseudolabrys sp.]|nr:DUF3800 domain-containing protein [Pseudolabrys sp.]
MKFSAMKNGPALVGDLLACLIGRDNPVFVEIVDKNFFICTTMVNHFVIPPVFHEFESRVDVLRMKNDVAEHLHMTMPREVMRAYLAACGVPSGTATRRAFDALLAWLRPTSATDQNARFILQFAEKGLTDFENAVKAKPETRAFLPEPDQGKARKVYWMLPNLSSMTNVYARINNLYRRRKMDGVRLIHDEQLQFDHILNQGKLAAERLAAEGRTWPFQHADYAFAEAADLLFARSHESLGIQIADVAAGFTMRYVHQVNVLAELPEREEIRAFQTLLETAEPERGTGANFVVSYGDFARLGLFRA